MPEFERAGEGAWSHTDRQLLKDKNDKLNSRTELQNRIWKIANDVRGSVDGWDFKHFVHSLPTRRVSRKLRPQS